MTEQINQEYTRSSRKRRMAAYFLDHFVMSFILISSIFIFLGPDFIDSDPEKLRSVLLTGFIPWFIIYIAKDIFNGISIGRWVMGIMVRDADNFSEIPSKGKLLLRNITILILPIEFLVLAINEEKNRIGDKITNTVVLRNPDKAARGPRIFALIGISVVFILFTVFFTAKSMKSSEAYKLSVQQIELNDEVITKTGGITGYGMVPTGNISVTNGHGNAHLIIKVKGIERNVLVQVYLTKNPNDDWVLQSMESN